MDCYRARIRVVVLAVLLSVAASASWAQRISIGPDQRYLLLATQRTATMQAELDEAAAAGFRIVAGSPAAAEMVLFLERVTEPPDTYTYRLLATSRTSTMERELNDAAAEGFRLLPQTAMAHASTTRRLLGGASAPNEVVVVMERGPRAETRYGYKLLATSRTSTLQREVLEAVESGWELITLLSRDEHMVVMERSTER